MPRPSIFDVNKQLTFYGAYHANPINVAIHIVCVPLIMWSAQVFLADYKVQTSIPSFRVNDYMSFETNGASIFAAIYLVYYFILEPVAALLYTPVMFTIVTTATTFSQRPDHLTLAAITHVICWIAQFIGHGVAEGRAPALLDNLLGAVVLAPFFVHLEILFKLGYRPALHKRLTNDIGTEITRVRRLEGDKKRAAAAAASKKD